jgi:hypothetical protein
MSAHRRYIDFLKRKVEIVEALNMNVKQGSSRKQPIPIEEFQTHLQKSFLEMLQLNQRQITSVNRGQGDIRQSLYQTYRYMYAFLFYYTFKNELKNEDERHAYIHGVLQECLKKLYNMNKELFNTMTETDMRFFIRRNYKVIFEGEAWDLYRIDKEAIQTVKRADLPIRDAPNTPRQSAEKPPRSASSAKSSPIATVKRLLAALSPIKS